MGEDFGDHNGYPLEQRLADAELIASAPSLKRRVEELEIEVNEYADEDSRKALELLEKEQENEKLKEELRYCKDKSLVALGKETELELTALRADNARLREALEKILKFSRVDYVTEIATEALKTPQ
jgi:hypothetical protein